MESIYILCNISRQAHHKAMLRHYEEIRRMPLYIRMMEEVRDIHPGMGLRTMYEMLSPETIGRDAFISLGLSEGFRLKSIEKYTRTTFSVKSNRYKNLLKDKVFTDINQVWTSDITYYALGEKFYYITFIMDVYSRRIIGYSLADNMRAENNVKALEMALKTRGIKDYKHSLIHHSDKGSQYASDVYTQLLDEYKIKISMCDEVYENTHIERLNDTIKNQYLHRLNITNEKELRKVLAKVIQTYNEQRPHQGISKSTPINFENDLKKTPKKKRIKLTIFTIDKNDSMNNNSQLNLFNN